MKDIIIVGAGHLGIDVYYLLEEINQESKRWNIKGFINDLPVDLSRFKLPVGIIGTIDGWTPSENEVFAMAIGSPDGKESVAEKLISRGAVFETLISPNAYVKETASVGSGSLIFRGASLGPCASVGKFTCIGHGTTVAMDASVDDYSNTASWVNIYKSVKVGSKCQLWSTSVILNSVGDFSTVGAGSVVVGKVRKGTKVMGNPAKRIDF